MKLFFEEIRSKYPASDAAQKKEHLGAYIGTTLLAKITPQQYSGQKTYCLYLLDLEDEERMTFGGRFNYIAQAIAEANAWYLENHQKINRSKPSAYPAVALPSSDEAEFYPTPSHIAGYMIRRIDWKNRSWTLCWHGQMRQLPKRHQNLFLERRCITRWSSGRTWCAIWKTADWN